MLNNSFLGIDTSNYTTSTALLEKGEIVHSKMLLPVKKGEVGLRQSDAVFHHTRQLPRVIEKLNFKDLTAIGVSSKPRNVLNSYMPCFLVGEGVADTLAHVLSIPVFKFSHQQGHIAAALYSAKRTDLLEKEFIAFHLSGGTSEVVHVKNGVLGDLEIISKTLDLNAGQAVDRVGIKLGMNFPCGKELDELSDMCSDEIKVNIKLKDDNFSLSGVENQCEKLIQEGREKEYIAKYCLEYIAQTMVKLCEKLETRHKDLPLLFSGGVASNKLLLKRIKVKFSAYFASPDFSCDNAAGVALLAEYKFQNKI